MRMTLSACFINNCHLQQESSPEVSVQKKSFSLNAIESLKETQQ